MLFDLKFNHYKLFIFKTIIFLVIVFLLDFLVGKTLYFLYFHQKSGSLYRTTYSIEKTNAEMLVMGSSRANHHYAPYAFENRLGLSYYNVGRDGQYLLYNYAILKVILKRYSPKIIIFDFVNQELEFDSRDYERLASLMPYYKKYPDIQPILQLKSSFEKIKLLSQIYPFNSYLLTIAIGNTNFNRRDVFDIKGYIPLDGKWNELIKTTDNSRTIKIDSNKLKIYELFIQDCLKAHVKLYIVCSPYYFNFKSTPLSITLGKKIAAKYHIDFYDFSQNPSFISKPALFDDPYHLNDTGAKIFSDSIVNLLIK